MKLYFFRYNGYRYKRKQECYDFLIEAHNKLEARVIFKREFKKLDIRRYICSELNARIIKYEVPEYKPSLFDREKNK